MNLRLLRQSLLAMAAMALVLLATGCGTTEPDNASTRPWNSPKGWEGGVPGMLYDRR